MVLSKKIALALIISAGSMYTSAFADMASQDDMDSFVKSAQSADHIYSFQKGLEYGYEQELSKNSQDNGMAQTPLMFFKYFGYKGTVYTVGDNDANGSEGRASCDLKNLCSYITVETYVLGNLISSQVIPGDGTIAQAALIDAMAGNLAIYNPDVDKIMLENDWSDNDKYSDALLETLSPENQGFANTYWPAEKSCEAGNLTPESKKECQIAYTAYRALHKINVCWTQDSPYSDASQRRWGVCPPSEDLIISSIPPAPVIPPAPKASPPPPTPAEPQQFAPAAPAPVETPPTAAPAATEKQEVPQGKTGPSFDCRKAYFADEVTICNTPSLAESDVELSRKYALAKKAAQDQKLFLSAQRQALVDRRDCHTDVNCLSKWYQDRNAALDSVINGATQ